MVGRSLGGIDWLGVEEELLLSNLCAWSSSSAAALIPLWVGGEGVGAASVGEMLSC